MRRLIAAIAVTAGLAACSSPEDGGAPPPTADEKQAVEDARAMIPESEQPPAVAAPAPLPVLTPGPDVTATREPDYGTPPSRPESSE